VIGPDPGSMSDITSLKDDGLLGELGDNEIILCDKGRIIIYVDNNYNQFLLFSSLIYRLSRTPTVLNTFQREALNTRRRRY
jgi:hypothetical protein